MTKNYPILFTFIDKVSGKGFLAKVSVDGRALAVEEVGGWWMYGVQPGDLAAGGTTFAEAAQGEFRKTFRAILFEIAEESDDFKTFKAEVVRFSRNINVPTEEEWKAAVQEVRAGRPTADAIALLPTKPADSPRGFEVKLLQAPKPQDNVLDPQMAVAA